MQRNGGFYHRGHEGRNTEFAEKRMPHRSEEGAQRAQNTWRKKRITSGRRMVVTRGQLR